MLKITKIMTIKKKVNQKEEVLSKVKVNQI
jgi:hypothetical protein